jgi:4-nitrophenyl phosphatase
MTAYRNYFFDCDGVLWHGDNVLPGVKDHLAQLRYRGKNVFFLTNSALKTREQLLAKFQQLGIEAKKEECYTSAYAAALFLKSQGFSSNGKRAFVVGMGALEKELAEAGVDFCGGTQTPLIPPSEDESIGAVVVGIDLAFNYEKLVQASLLLRYKPDVLFIGAWHSSPPRSHSVPPNPLSSQPPMPTP